MVALRIVSIAIVLSVSSATCAQDDAARFVEAQEKYRAGDLDGAMQRLDSLLETEELDQPSKRRVWELAVRVLQRRGEEHFRQAQIAKSIADFDRQLQLQPERAAEHWQRGIACYYAGEYERGARQFELHQTVNPQDVENAVWHFLCVVRAPEGSVDVARKKLIPVTRDPRVLMAQIHQLFVGRLSPEEILAAGEQGGDTARFYAQLYVGLFYEALDRKDESLRLIAQAAACPAAKDSYMGDVARVHVLLRKQSAAKKK